MKGALWPMRRYLRSTLPMLLLLAVTGCARNGLDDEHRLLVSAAQADAFNEGRLDLLSDEREHADGLVVYFDTDSASVAPRYLPRLAYVANYLVTHPQTDVCVEGHTDATGSPEQNLLLAQARADMLAYVLVKYGALYDQVSTRAYGERYPVREGAGEDEVKLNRRGVVEWWGDEHDR